MGGPWDNVSYLQFLPGLHRANASDTIANITNGNNGSDATEGFGTLGTEVGVGSIWLV